jgi:thiol:disulfide interchange protein DsbC
MKKLKWMLALLLASSVGVVAAETAEETALRKLVQPRIGGDATIDSVTKTPYSGLFEIRIGSDIFYSDAQAKYLFVGRVIDTATMKDLTQERVQDLSRIKFSDLPLDAAVKKVKGNGKRVIAVFEDPNCGYCKRFHQTLEKVDNVTVYTFLYSVLGPDSVTKSRNIWCAADRSKTWNDWMLRGKVPPAAQSKCDTPHEKVMQLGRQLGVTGTPTIFFVDGTRIPGAIDAKGLEDKFATLQP